jgi:aspartyl/glutamyl-tRNA(Asn/Gln) amidotransferase C subunit
MDIDGIKKLSELSRLDLTESEMKAYAGEFSDILEYVDTLKEAVDETDDNLILENSSNRNVLRQDENPHESGVDTDNLVDAAPESQDNYIKVKKIL